MNVAYLIKTKSSKGNEKFVWSDTGKSARIHREIPNQLERRAFENNPATLQEAIKIASTYSPSRKGLAKRVEVTFIEPELHLDSDSPYFTVNYVEARR